MINLFLDTNTYLAFYHLTSDDLEELKKLQHLINKADGIKLWLPDQTQDEYRRNREVKIEDALKRFKEEKLNNQFPQMCKEYDEFKNMREAIKTFDQNKTKLLDKLYTDINSYNLEADKIIDTLFSSAQAIETTPDLLNLARTRFDLGRPPGKNNSYGDALNWESLLNSIPEKEDLYFVSDDKDYFSALNQQLFNTYLNQEWTNKKSSKIYFYKRISEFFKDKFPDIDIASEVEKDNLIDELYNSSNFASTRRTLIKLSKYATYSSTQINQFVSACLNNSQIYWIREDSDIRKYITDIVNANISKIEPELLEEYGHLY